jgi:hypothetical protein
LIGIEVSAGQDHEGGDGHERDHSHEPWYRYGVAVLVIEMGIAIAVGVYALYMALHGMGGFHGGS